MFSKASSLVEVRSYNRHDASESQLHSSSQKKPRERNTQPPQTPPINASPFSATNIPPSTFPVGHLQLSRSVTAAQCDLCLSSSEFDSSSSQPPSRIFESFQRSYCRFAQDGVRKRARRAPDERDSDGRERRRGDAHGRHIRGQDQGAGHAVVRQVLRALVRPLPQHGAGVGGAGQGGGGRERHRDRHRGLHHQQGDVHQGRRPLLPVP